MTEDDFERAVVDLSHIFGWYAVGHRPMRTNHGWATGWKYDGTGWPDLTLIHPERGQLVLAELKVTTDLSDDQQVWATRLRLLADRAAGLDGASSIQYHVWRPTDSNEIARILSNHRQMEWTLVPA